MNCKQDGCDKPVKYRTLQLCHRHYNYAWAKANPEKVAAQRQRYSTKHRDAIREKNKKWAAKNSRNPVTQEHITDSVKERFFAKVDKTGSCWNWTAAKTAYRKATELAPAQQGYGVMTVNNRPFYTHRLSWLMHNGPLIPGLVIDHICNNTLCVNPQHLQQITNDENTKRSPRHVANGARYYKEYCKYGHKRTPEMRGKQCFHCRDIWLAKQRKRGKKNEK